MLWYRVVCSQCKEGTQFFTLQKPEGGLIPLAERAVSNDFTTPSHGDCPHCDHCLEPCFTNQYVQVAEDHEVVDDELINKLLDDIQNNREDL